MAQYSGGGLTQVELDVIIIMLSISIIIINIKIYALDYGNAHEYALNINYRSRCRVS